MHNDYKRKCLYECGIKVKVAPGKLTGWKRLVGQEVPIDAESDLCTIAGTSGWMAPSVGLQLNAGGSAPVAPVNAALTARRQSKILNGPQTPKLEQGQLDMWIPLLFWFNKDARLSIPSVAIPYGEQEELNDQFDRYSLTLMFAVV